MLLNFLMSLLRDGIKESNFVIWFTGFSDREFHCLYEISGGINSIQKGQRTKNSNNY